MRIYLLKSILLPIDSIVLIISKLICISPGIIDCGYSVLIDLFVLANLSRT